MKLWLGDLDNDIEISSEHISSIEIYRAEMYAEYQHEFYYATEGEDSEKIRLLEGEKEIDMSRYAIYASDINLFDLNDKKIIGKITKCIADTVVKNEELMLKCGEAVNRLEQLCDGFIADIFIPIGLSYGFDPAKYLKYRDLRIENNDAPCMEKLHTLIDITAEYFKEQFLLLCGVKTILDDEKLSELYKYTIYRGVKMLTLDRGKGKKPLLHEKKLYIDENYDEFLLE